MPNPFGVQFGSGRLARFDPIAVARALGVAHVRPEVVYLDQALEPQLAPLARYVDAGLQLVLTLQTSGGPGQPAEPMASLSRLKAHVRQVVQALPLAALIFGNEPLSRRLYWKGSTEDYLAHLEAVAEAAAPARVPVADGGLDFTHNSLLLVERLLAEGHAPEALAAAQQLLGDRLPVRADSPGPDTPTGLQRLLRRRRGPLDDYHRLLAGYRQAGSDYVNFHWYDHHAAYLTALVAILEEDSRLPAITNEFGLRTDDPAATAEQTRALQDLALALAVRYSIDGRHGLRARALQDPDGRLRPSGHAFAAIVTEIVTDIEPQRHEGHEA